MINPHSLGATCEFWAHALAAYPRFPTTVSRSRLPVRASAHLDGDRAHDGFNWALVHNLLFIPVDSAVQPVLSISHVNDSNDRMLSFQTRAFGVVKTYYPPSKTAMMGGMFNWPDGDVILRATHDGQTRDFRVHKSFLSFSSSVFKHIFATQRPHSVSPDGVNIIEVADSPRALELVLRFVYPSPSPPIIDDLTVLSEALVLADEYNIEVARTQLRLSFIEFAKTESLRAYAIACRLGLTDEMRIASFHTTSIHLPSIGELPEEFKFIPATEYHRLVLLHARYRKEVEATASRTPLPGFSLIDTILSLPAFLDNDRVKKAKEKVRAREFAKDTFRGRIRDSVALNPESLVNALKAEGNFITAISNTKIQSHVGSILGQADDLNLTV